MNEFPVKHLVLARHGEGEGDERRRRSKAGLPPGSNFAKHPIYEEETETGRLQSIAAGAWIKKYIFGKYNFETFDWQRTSPLIRTRQSAQSTNIGGEWVEEPRLTERNRGRIQGMTQQQHKIKYPNSYRQMKETPYLWVPPGGVSILRVSNRSTELIDEFIESSANTAIFMTHRDFMWSTFRRIHHLNYEEIEQVDTNAIENSQILHSTNVNPESGKPEGKELIWERSVTPWGDNMLEQTETWIDLRR